jgi:outer membrane receptor protein involved in Fe transport
MRPHPHGSASLPLLPLLLLQAVTATAQTVAPPPEPIQQVMVSGATVCAVAVTAIVVGREELLRQGDASLTDVLKRQPGITVDAAPGRQPAIRMRGMGSGYVLILLNGVAAPSGFALESISPDLVERVEIQRVATAETGGQAVAGAINIILLDGYAAPTLVAQHNGQAGPLAYLLVATLKRNRNPVTSADIDEAVHDGQATLLRRTAGFDHQVEDMLELAPRLNWRAGALDSFSSQTFVRARRTNNGATASETTEIGAPSAFPRAASGYRAHPLKAYADLAWSRRLQNGASLNTKLIAAYTRIEGDFMYRGMEREGGLLETHRVASGPVERETIFNGSWRRPVGAGHALAAGWEFGHKRRGEYRREHQFDAAGNTLLASDEDYRASVRRSAFFIQDEWDLTPAWSAYVGLRREALRTSGGGTVAAAPTAPVDVGSSVWSPIMQTLYKLQPDTNGRGDQFRLAVGRSYKAPNIAQLLPRRYTVDNANSATNPDQQGNPNLRPELALNLDLAWERYLSKDSMLSLSAFDKRIDGVTLSRLFQNGGTWIVMPDNAGRARVRGLEFDAKTTRGGLAGRVNLARNWSRLEQVPGPDNRIDGQPAWSGNLGLDYAVSAKLDVGGNAGYRGGYASRQSAVQASEGAPKRQLDLYALWKMSRTARLRMSAADLLHQDYLERSIYTGDGYRVRGTLFRTHTTWRVVWEQSL